MNNRQRRAKTPFQLIGKAGKSIGRSVKKSVKKGVKKGVKTYMDFTEKQRQYKKDTEWKYSKGIQTDASHPRYRGQRK